MRIALVNPPTLHRWKPVSDATSAQVMTPYFRQLLAADLRMSTGRSSLPGEHLGLQSLAASLRSAGHEVVLIDGCVELHETVEATAMMLRSTDADLIGITGPADVYGEVRWIARDLRRSGFAGTVVLGHDHATLNAARILKNEASFDAVIRGEGEQALVALAAAVQAGESLAEVPGLTWRYRGSIRENPVGKSIRLDDLPVPSRDLTSRVLDLGMSASIFTKRGCPYRCSFCTTGLVAESSERRGGDAWRKKSPASAANEMMEFVRRFDLDHVTIVDDLFLARDSRSGLWAEEFCQTLIDGDNEATFMIDCRADSLDTTTVAMLRRAGLRRVFMGVESASQTALESYGKSYGARSPTEAIQVLRDQEVEVVLGFIFFGHYDNLDGLAASARFLAEAGMDDFGLHLQRTRVYPGTTLEGRLRRDGLLTGAFPFYESLFADKRVALVQQLVKQLGHFVAGEVEDLRSLSRGDLRHLFVAFNHRVTELVELVGEGTFDVDGWVDASRDDMARLIQGCKDDCDEDDRQC